MSEVPEIVRKVGFNFSWDEEKVWKLNYPTKSLDICKLEWHFEIPFWNFGGGSYNLKPRSVIENKKLYFEEFERIMNSDLGFPIDIMENKGRFLILDGLHRLLKAKILGKTEVKVRIIPNSEIKNIIKSS